MACTHWPRCPEANTTDAKAARLVADHWEEQGWALLCNGLVVFDDGGLMLPQPVAA